MVTQSEIEFRASAGGTSQNELLAAHLRSHPDVWLPMPALARVITDTGIGAAVHSRIADCRRKFGMAIEHKGGRNRDSGRNESFYRYVPNPNHAIKRPETTTHLAPDPG